MVHARSIVASRNGAAGYKVDAILARDIAIIGGPAQRTRAVEKGETTVRQLIKPP